MARILLLGPERERAADVRRLLASAGHQVAWLRSLENWRAKEREVLPEIVVAAVATNGKVLASRSGPAHGFLAPLLFIRKETDFAQESGGHERLVDRLASPFMREEFLGRVDALIRVRRVVLGNCDEAGETPSTKSGAGRTLHGISRRVSEWLKSRMPPHELPSGPYLEVAARVAEWADHRDAFEPGHAERVTSFCAMIAEGLQMSDEETSLLLRAAMLHDIGKVAIPVEMLHQKAPLEDSQLRLLRTHTAKGAALLRALDPDEKLVRVVLYHHERPDGGGYYGTKAGRVPRAAYALAVAETFDAMTSSRLRRPLEPREALDYLQGNRGDRYDPDCVDALLDQLRPRRRSVPVSVLS